MRIAWNSCAAVSEANQQVRPTQALEGLPASRTETFPRRGVSLPYIRATVKLLGKWFLILALAAPFCTRAADMLHWDADHNRVDAEITTWTVPQLLQRIAAITGWEVLMEPSIN